MSESFTFRHFFASSASFIDAQYHTAEEGLAPLCIQFYIMASLPQEHSRNFGSLSAFFMFGTGNLVLRRNNSLYTDAEGKR